VATIVPQIYFLLISMTFHNKHTKVCSYRTRPRLGGVREGMVEIKQTKVVYTERESEHGTRL